MKKHIIYLPILLCIWNCGSATSAEVPSTSNTTDLYAKFIAQIHTWQYNQRIPNDSFRFDWNSEIYVDSLAKFSLNHGTFWRPNSYGDILAHGKFKVITFDSAKYLWLDVDFFDKSFWDSTDITASAPAAVSWNFESLVRDINLRMPCEYPIYTDSAQKCYLNSQRYAKATNNLGKVIDISHYGQFKELNQFLYANTYYRGQENIYRIKALIELLQQEKVLPREHKMAINHYIDFNSSYFFAKSMLKELDTSRLKIRGVDLYQNRAYYLEEILTTTKIQVQSNSDSIKNIHYVGYTQTIDSLQILQAYQNNQKPTFLYYKQAGSSSAGWYNYFIAYHIAYTKNGIPSLEKICLICPQRVYHYWCFPAGICDDAAGSIYRNAAYAHNENAN